MAAAVQSQQDKSMCHTQAQPQQTCRSASNMTSCVILNCRATRRCPQSGRVRRRALQCPSRDMRLFRGHIFACDTGRVAPSRIAWSNQRTIHVAVSLQSCSKTRCEVERNQTKDISSRREPQHIAAHGATNPAQSPRFSNTTDLYHRTCEATSDCVLCTASFGTSVGTYFARR